MSQRIFTNQVFSNTGTVGEGFKIYFYETGTTTLQDTFSDEALSIANLNPIVADSNGRFTDVFVENKRLYKSVLTDVDDNTLKTLDPIDPDISSLEDFDPRPLSFWGTTAGDANNYTLEADPTLTENSSTDIFAVAIHINCNASCDLAIDGQSTKDLKKYDGAGSKVDLEAGDLQANQRYFITDDGVDYIVKDSEIKEKVINNSLIIPDNGELTILSGSITPTDSQHTMDTESDASTDDLDTINITNLPTGKMMILSIINSARNVIIKHGTGNIITDNQEDITLDVTNDRFVGISDGTNIIELSRTLTTTLSRGDAKAWVIFDPTGTILNSLNTASVVRNNLGDFTWTFTTPFSTTSWVLVGTGQLDAASNLPVGIAMNNVSDIQSLGSVTFNTQLSTTGANVDPLKMWMVAFGDQ